MRGKSLRPGRLVCGLIAVLFLAVIAPNILPMKNNVAVSEAAKIKISKKKLTINKGKSKKLKIKGTSQTVKWTSSNTKVATVTQKGKVKGKKAGKAKITGEVNGKKYKCTVTVKIPVKKVTLKKSNIEIYEGNSKKLKAKVLPKKATDKKVVWTSSDPSIASVDSNGKVTGIKAGTAVITAKSGKKKAKCTVTVVLYYLQYSNNEWLAANGLILLQNKLENPDSLQVHQIRYKKSAHYGDMIYVDYSAKISKDVTVRDYEVMWRINYAGAFSLSKILETIQYEYIDSRSVDSNQVGSLKNSETINLNNVLKLKKKIEERNDYIYNP